MEQQNRHVQIPAFFTRSKKCDRCAQNHIPLQNRYEVMMCKNPVRFVVQPSSKLPSVDSLMPRRQTKPGVLGFTPHLFIQSDILEEDNKKIYVIQCYCGVEGCGIHFQIHNNGWRELQFLRINETLLLSHEELVHYYETKNFNYLLDYKEQQQWFDYAHMKQPCLS